VASDPEAGPSWFPDGGPADTPGPRWDAQRSSRDEHADADAGGPVKAPHSGDAFVITDQPEPPPHASGHVSGHASGPSAGFSPTGASSTGASPTGPSFAASASASASGAASGGPASGGPDPEGETRVFALPGFPGRGSGEDRPGLWERLGDRRATAVTATLAGVLLLGVLLVMSMVTDGITFTSEETQPAGGSTAIVPPPETDPGLTVPVEPAPSGGEEHPAAPGGRRVAVRVRLPVAEAHPHGRAGPVVHPRR
jgi:hypothetical protein